MLENSQSMPKLLNGAQPQRAGDFRYPVRTEPLPTALSFALYPEHSSSSFSFSICSGNIFVCPVQDGEKR
jgi:hypothetical protein